MYLKEAHKKVNDYYVSVIFYRVVLDLCFKTIIAPIYGYDGFYNKWTFETWLISWILLFCGTLGLKRVFENKEKLISFEILFFLFLFSFVPFTCMVAFNDLSQKFVVINSVYWFFLVLFITIQRPIKKYPVLKIGNLQLIGTKQIEIIAIMTIMVIAYISWRYTHFRINLNLGNVYTLRAEAATFKMPKLLIYFFSFTRSLNAVLIAYFVHTKKLAWSILCFFSQLLSFGIDGSKLTLFIAVLAVMVNLLPEFNFSALNQLILRGFGLLATFCMLCYTFLHNIWPVSLFVRRVLFVPLHIAVNYIDFFTTHTPDYFKQGFLRYFGFKSDYPGIAYMIGDIYSKQVTSANNGLVSDAVANLGIVGIVIFPLLIAVILRLFDYCINGLDSRIYISVAVSAAMSLTNSFLFTVLLTHGLFVTMMVLAMVKKKGC